MTKHLIIMRGWPGIGKSTLAKAIAERSFDNKTALVRDRAVIVSADNYFIKDGIYKYIADDIPKAHQWCRQQAVEMMVCGFAGVIIDNTNIKQEHYSYYVAMAHEYDYQPCQAIPETPWMYDLDECFKRNIHNVPRDVVKRMMENFENDPGLPIFKL